MKKVVNIFLSVFGGIFILLGVIAIYNTVFWNVEHIIWFSNIMLILIGYGLLARNSLLISSCVNIIAIPNTFWTLDFFYYLIFGKGLFGLIDYFFEPGWLLINKIVSIQHVTIIPLAIISLYFLKVKRKDSWKLSLILTSIIFFMTRLFTSPEGNINCVYKSCLQIGFPEAVYPFVWFAITFLMIFTTNFILTNLKFLRFKKNKNLAFKNFHNN